MNKKLTKAEKELKNQIEAMINKFFALYAGETKKSSCMRLNIINKGYF